MNPAAHFAGRTTRSRSWWRVAAALRGRPALGPLAIWFLGLLLLFGPNPAAPLTAIFAHGCGHAGDPACAHHAGARHGAPGGDGLAACLLCPLCASALPCTPAAAQFTSRFLGGVEPVAGKAPRRTYPPPLPPPRGPGWLAS